MKRTLEVVVLVVSVLSGISNAAAGAIVIGEVCHWWNLL